MIEYLAQVHETEVRQAKVHVGEPSAGEIHRSEAEIGNDPGGELPARFGVNLGRS